MGKSTRAAKRPAGEATRATPRPGKPSALLDTRVIYCRDNLERLAKLPPQCVDLIYIDPLCEEIEQSFNSNRNYAFADPAAARCTTAAPTPSAPRESPPPTDCQ